MPQLQRTLPYLQVIRKKWTGRQRKISLAKKKSFCDEAIIFACRGKNISLPVVYKKAHPAFVYRQERLIFVFLNLFYNYLLYFFRIVIGWSQLLNYLR